MARQQVGAGRHASDDVRRYVRAVTVAGVTVTVPYLLVLWDLGLHVFRTAIPTGFFSNFYDLQARAFLDGRLAVPRGSLGIEAFVVDGRELMYFPPGPALLRMPLLALTDRFDGRLTALSLLAAWVTTIVLVAALLWRVRVLLRPGAPLGRLEAAGYGVLVAASTGGSVVLFLASLPWVYHEAYAWAIPMAIGTAHCLIGAVVRPRPRAFLATGAFTLGAVLCRTTAGWACAGAVLAAALWLALRAPATARRRNALLLLAGIVPLAVGVAINWAKFHHPYLFPLEDQLWTSVSDHRVEALEANGGDLINLNILPSTVVNYFRPDGIRFISLFPFVTLPGEVAHSFGGGFLDQTYRTGSVPMFMPALFVLAVWGVVAAFRRGDRGPQRAALRLALLGVLAIPGGIMFYGYISYRYTSEFVPLLVVGSAVGVADVARRLGGRSLRLQGASFAALVVLAVFSVAANTAVAFTTSRTTSPGPRLRDYVIYQEKISSLMGDPIDAHVRMSDELPPVGPADQLRIIGQCRSWHIGTGDPLEPWIVVEAREAMFELRGLPVTERLPIRGSIQLARFEGLVDAPLWLDRLGRGSYQLRVVYDDIVLRTNWFRLQPGEERTVRVRTDTELLRYTIEGDGMFPIVLPMRQMDADLLAMPELYVPTLPTASAAAGQRVAITDLPTPPLEWCERVLARQRGVSS